MKFSYFEHTTSRKTELVARREGEELRHSRREL
jgi:hypothetical protein